MSIAALGILTVWIILYTRSDPKTYLGSFFGNAIADWTGVAVTVIATKYFYEVGSAESRQPRRAAWHSKIAVLLRKHSLTIFLIITGAAWTWLYLRLGPQAKWGEVAGNIVSEWTQLLGLVLLTKRLIEKRSKESH